MSDIFTAISFLLTVSKIIGLGSFYVDKKKKKLHTSVVGLLYSCLMLFCFTGNAGFLTYTKLLYKDKRIDSYVGLASDVILLTCGIVVTFTCILFSMIQRKKTMKVIEEFYKIHWEMKKLKQDVNYLKLKKKILCHVLLLLFILLLIFFLMIFYVENLKSFLYFSYMYAWFVPNIYNFLTGYQFVSGAELLKIHFKALNKSLEKFDDDDKDKEDDEFANNNNNKRPEMNFYFDSFPSPSLGKNFTNVNYLAWEFRTANKFHLIKNKKLWKHQRKIWPGEKEFHDVVNDLNKIKRIRKIHGNLCGIKEHLNSSFSLQVLSSVAQSFIFITVNLYLIFTTLSSEDSSVSLFKISYPVLWFVIHSLELIIIVLTCTNTSKAGNYTAVLVHKLLAKECKLELKNQLKLFSIQLLHRKICFTAAGFFNLDMALLQGVIGAATTYLVILIQFHNTYEVRKN
ncbi:Gustatory receptor PhGr1 [Pediculus humanus corporis]|uniref:Gustatory receptor n=1 Tax=Pediculus humanus subsp. corporis TaxID=121224 RepID=E0VH80_PEDHC|nr:Gustatory receptor PhGr1 [Pediculus humanus corporis]EEB12736.1 Gustatory receptor PhGr1 [Pediculus humanus corporis]